MVRNGILECGSMVRFFGTLKILVQDYHFTDNLNVSIHGPDTP